MGVGVWFLVVTCGFSFKVRGEEEVVELADEHRHSALVCKACLVLLTAHRRAHHMNRGGLLLRWLSLSPCWLKREACLNSFGTVSS